MRTTIAVDQTLRDRLAELKRTWRLRSLEEVVERLVSGSPEGAMALYRSNKGAVDKVLRDHGVTSLVAFGSRARGDARPDSDLDLVATLPKDADLFKVSALRQGLEDAFHIPVNLLTPGGVNERLSKHIEADGVVLVG